MYHADNTRPGGKLVILPERTGLRGDLPSFTGHAATRLDPDRDGGELDPASQKGTPGNSLPNAIRPHGVFGPLTALGGTSLD